MKSDNFVVFMADFRNAFYHEIDLRDAFAPHQNQIKRIFDMTFAYAGTELINRKMKEGFGDEST